MQHTTRIAVLLDAIDPKCAALTYIWEGQRVVVPLTREELRRAGSRWTKPMIRAWFGRDPNRLFFFVPQVAVYPDHGIPVSADWIDPLPPSASAL